MALPYQGPWEQLRQGLPSIPKASPNLGSYNGHPATPSLPYSHLGQDQPRQNPHVQRHLPKTLLNSAQQDTATKATDTIINKAMERDTKYCGREDATSRTQKHPPNTCPPVQRATFLETLLPRAQQGIPTKEPDLAASLY